MCSIGVPAAAGVCGVCLFSLCWCCFLPQSRDIRDRWTGDCSECEYECVWWTGHLSRGLSCLWPRKGSSLMTIHRTSARKNVWNKWMNVQYCECYRPPSLCHSFSPTNVSFLIHVSKPNHSKAIHLSKDNQKRKKERKKKKTNLGQQIWLCFQLKLHLVVFGIIIIQFHHKYSAKILYFNIIPAEMDSLPSFWFESTDYQFWKQCKAFKHLKMCGKCTVFCSLWSMNDKMWSLHAFCLKAMKNDSQFGPHRLLYRWMCEQFWKCGFSIEQCMLAIII